MEEDIDEKTSLEIQFQQNSDEKPQKPEENSQTMSSAEAAEAAAAKAVHKRYEGLAIVRTKALKGKGAWYWAHLEPLLVHNADTGLPKAVKLKCCLCDSIFSASNPSRTASEHLKRGTCPNFSSPTNPKPLSSLSPPPESHSLSSNNTNSSNHRKRSSVVHQHQPLTLPLPLPDAGGVKDDLSVAKGMFEDSIKRLKSPKATPGCALNKSQIDCAIDYLSEWLYESCGSVSFSSLEHPKFRAFLEQVGMPEVCKREICGSRLDAKYEEVRNEAEVRMRDVSFFQIASDGWKSNLVNLVVNLPNGSNVYRRGVFMNGEVGSNSKYAEEILWETVNEICGNGVHKCVGIVGDKYKNKALRNLEKENEWMVNLSCQYEGLNKLIKDFYREVPLFKNVAENCLKVGDIVNNKTQVRKSFHKYQLREYGYAALVRVPKEIRNFEGVYGVLEDIMRSVRVLQLVVLDESYKLVSMEDPIAREFGEMIRDVGFWNDLEAVRTLVRLVKDMANEFETDRGLVGQCLPLWEEVRSKVKEWCVKFHIPETHVEKVVERRFRKNYHPAWAASYILDPLYLVRDNSGKYIPPFKFLTQEQEKDVDKLITRLVSREEAHIALMELMKWRTLGLDPVYAQAVQMKERDPFTGKIKFANPHGSRLLWETYLPEFKSLGKVALRLIFLHATARPFNSNSNSSFFNWVQAHGPSKFGFDRAHKIIFIAAQSKLTRRQQQPFSIGFLQDNNNNNHFDHP